MTNKSRIIGWSLLILWGLVFQLIMPIGWSVADMPVKTDSSHIGLKSGFLIVRGILEGEGQIRVYPLMVLPERTMDLPDEQGEFTLEALSADHRVLGAYRFGPKPLHLTRNSGPDQIMDSGSFIFQIPFDQHYEKLIIKKNGRTIWEQNRTGVSSPIRINKPLPGTILNGLETIEISHDDHDKNRFIFFYRYSPDGGKNWEPLSSFTQETTLEVDTGTLSPSKAGKIQVFASHGFNTSMAEVAVQVQNPLEIQYTVPPNGERDVSTTPTIYIKFKAPLKNNEFNTRAFSLLKNGRHQVDVQVVMEEGDDTVLLRPIEPLEDGQNYTVKIKSGIKDIYSNFLQSGYEWEFRTMVENY